MVILLGFTLSAIFFALSALHMYWGIGRRSVNNTAVPSTETGKAIMKPGIIACFTIAIGLLAFGVLALTKAQVLSWPAPFWLLRYGLWAIAVIFVARAIGEFRYVGFFKKIKNTAFGKMDTLYYSPLALLIGLLAVLLQLFSA